MVFLMSVRLSYRHNRVNQSFFTVLTGHNF